MARKSAAAVATAPEFVFDPDNLQPPSQVRPEHKEQYWTAILESIDLLRAACATEEFFPLLKEIPKALWERRFFVYLYRQWPKVKNADKDKYIDKYPRPIDEGEVKEEHGGGTYLAYLNLDGKEQLKQITFAIDGPPKFKPGQVLVDNAGNPLPPVVAQPTTEQSDLARVIETTSAASKLGMEMLTHASKSSIDMVTERAAAATSTVQVNPVDQIVQLATALKALMPAPAPADPAMAEVMKQIVQRAFREPAENPEPQTPISETLATVRELKEVLPDLLGKATKAAADSTPPWVAPLLQIGQTLIQQFPAIMAQAAKNRALEFERMMFLRNAKPNEPIPEKLLTAAEPAPPAQPTIQHLAQPQPTDPQSVVTGIIQMICHGFDRDPRQGYETAAAIAYAYSDPIESLGFSKTLGSAAEVDKFVAGLPELQRRSQDARWPMFREDFLNYTTDRWGEDEDEDEPVKTNSAAVGTAGPQPVA